MWAGLKITVVALLTSLILPQDFSRLELIKEFKQPIDFIRVDNFGKLFIVSENEISLYDKLGKPIAQNSNKLLGYVSELDVTNGLESSVFFEDQLQVIYIDNQLAQKGREISLDELGLQQVTKTCTSHGNGIWVFDQVKMELIRIDKNNNFIATSGNLMQQLGYAPNPVYMREISNWLYLADPDRGILVFDVFGSYYKTIPVKNIREFQIKGHEVIFFSNPHLITFNTKELFYDTIMNVEGNPKQVLLSKNQLNILYNNHLKLFRYTP